MFFLCIAPRLCSVFLGGKKRTLICKRVCLGMMMSLLMVANADGDQNQMEVVGLFTAFTRALDKEHAALECTE